MKKIAGNITVKRKKIYIIFSRIMLLISSNLLIGMNPNASTWNPSSSSHLGLSQQKMNTPTALNSKARTWEPTQSNLPNMSQQTWEPTPYHQYDEYQQRMSTPIALNSKARAWEPTQSNLPSMPQQTWEPTPYHQYDDYQQRMNTPIALNSKPHAWEPTQSNLPSMPQQTWEPAPYHQYDEYQQRMSTPIALNSKAHAWEQPSMQPSMLQQKSHETIPSNNPVSLNLKVPVWEPSTLPTQSSQKNMSQQKSQETISSSNPVELSPRSTTWEPPTQINNRYNNSKLSYDNEKLLESFDKTNNEINDTNSVGSESSSISSQIKHDNEKSKKNNSNKHNNVPNNPQQNSLSNENSYKTIVHPRGIIEYDYSTKSLHNEYININKYFYNSAKKLQSKLFTMKFGGIIVQAFYNPDKSVNYFYYDYDGKRLFSTRHEPNGTETTISYDFDNLELNKPSIYSSFNNQTKKISTHHSNELDLKIEWKNDYISSIKFYNPYYGNNEMLIEEITKNSPSSNKYTCIFYDQNGTIQYKTEVNADMKRRLYPKGLHDLLLVGLPKEFTEDKIPEVPHEPQN